MSLRKSFATLTIALGLCSGVAFADSVLTTNGGFETGDFTGWQTIGDALVVNSSFGIAPAQGTYQAFISDAPGGPSQYPNPGYPSQRGSASAFPNLLAPSPLESFMDLPAYSLYPAYANSQCGGPSAFCVPIEGSGLKQSFSANTGDVLSFDFALVTNDAPGFDFEFVTIDGAITILARPDVTACTQYPFVTLVGSATSPTGFRYDCNRQQFVATLTTTGTHTIGIGVVDTLDNSEDTGLLIDNVQLTSVPEPSTWLLLATGLVGIMAVKARSKRCL